MLHFLTDMTYETLMAIHSMAFVTEMVIAGMIEWRLRSLRKEETEARKRHARHRREERSWYDIEAERLYYKPRHRGDESVRGRDCA